MKFGCYCGLSIDLGLARTTKVLTQNGQVLHRSAYRPLNPDKITDKDGSDALSKESYSVQTAELHRGLITSMLQLVS